MTMYKRTLFVTMIVSFFLFALVVSGQRPAKKTPQVKPQKSTGGMVSQSSPSTDSPASSPYTALLNLTPPGAFYIEMARHPALIAQKFNTAVRGIGLDPARCLQAIGFQVPTRPQVFNKDTAAAFVFDTSQAQEIERLYIEKQVKTVIINGEKVFQFPGGAGISVHLVRLGNDRLLAGVQPAFSQVLAIARGKQKNIYYSRADLRPLFYSVKPAFHVLIRLVTPDELNGIRNFIRIVGDPGLRDQAEMVMAMRGIAYMMPDQGKCRLDVHMQFAGRGPALSAASMLNLMKFLSGDRSWNDTDIQQFGSLVKVLLSRTNADCSSPLIWGRVRLKDPEKNDQTWNITGVLEGSTVSVVPADAPDSAPILEMPVTVNQPNKEDNGMFSSKVTSRGKQADLVDGSRYVLKATLKYIDHIEVSNVEIIPAMDAPYITTGCQAPGSKMEPREVLRHSERFTFSKKNPKPQNVDFPPPLILMHGIRSCWSDWNAWAHHLATRHKTSQNQNSPVEGYITFTPTYDYSIIEDEYTIPMMKRLRETMAKQVVEQITRDVNRLLEKTSDIPAVTLIAHSNGGVIARVMSKLTGNSWRINKIYTLGSPHSGTRMPVAEDYGLSRKQMLRYNALEGGFSPNSKVLAIGGTAAQGCFLPMLTSMPSIGTSCKNDGLVYPHDSSYTIESYRGFFQSNGKTQAFPFRESRLYHSPSVGTPNFLDDGGISMFEALIIPDLERRVSATSPGQLSERSVREGESEPSQEAIPSAIESSFKVAPRTSYETSYVIPDTEGLIFMYGARAVKGQLIPTFIDPKGKQITPTNIRAYPGINLSRGELGEIIISIKRPLKGIWKVKFTGDASVQFNVLFDFGIALAGDSQQQEYTPSSTALLQAKIVGQQSAATVQSVTATLKDKAGKVYASSPMNGTGNMFRSEMMVPAVPGNYLVIYEAKGIYKGSPFQLQVESKLWVIR
jgi:pimeloyl-ACP methyl ester carboxylesterase